MWLQNSFSFSLPLVFEVLSLLVFVLLLGIVVSRLCHSRYFGGQILVIVDLLGGILYSAVCTVCTVEWSDLALFRLTKIATFLSIRYIFRSSITKKSAKASFQNIRNKFFIIVIPQSGQNGFWPGQIKNKKCLDCFLQKI